MSPSPVLSVLLTSHLPVNDLEEILLTLLDFQKSGLEILYVHDSDDPEQIRVLESWLEGHQTQHVKLLTNREPRGRAQSLNRALISSRGSYFWAPERAERPNQVVLDECLKRMKTDPAGCWILDRTLPDSPEKWFHELKQGTLPRDERFLFNRSAQPLSELFFRPGIEPFTASELAWRLSQKKPCETLDSFFIVNPMAAPTPAPSVLQEYLFSLLREVTDPGNRDPFIRELSSLSFDTPTEQSAAPLLDQARSLMEEDPRTAIEQVNEYLKNWPEDLEALKLKVLLLEKLRRHVEAAELKHTLSKREAESTQNVPESQTDPSPVSQPTLFEMPDTDPGDARQSGDNDVQPETTQPQSDAESESESKPEPEPEPTISQEGDYEAEQEKSPPLKLSIIIPTTGDGKGVLQETLLNLDAACDPRQTELIVIDNASIDDTFDYLQSLLDKEFLNIRVITNKRNRGFAASVNQGLDLARGEFIQVQHNDLLPDVEMIDELISILEDEPAIGAVGPTVDQCDQKEQTLEALGDETRRFLLVDQIDSCCMMIRSSNGLRFNEAYGLAWFEDADYCNHLKMNGLDVAVATRAHATHHHEVTTKAMGLRLENDLYWENADIFNARWHNSPDYSVPEEGSFSDKLSAIVLPVNPKNPPGYWLDQVEELLTDEKKTEIERTGLNKKDLLNLIRILIVADKRDFLRYMESRMDKAGITPPDDLLRHLIRFYYERNIYSRCRRYLNMPGTDHSYFDLYRLRIAVKEKETDQAVQTLNKLMEEFPCHPDLYQLAGDIYLQSGNREEADSFYELARQLLPDLEKDVDVFEIKY